MTNQNTDVIEKAIGKFGKYQAFVLVLLALGRLQASFQLYGYVFIIPKLDYICLDDAQNITNYCPCENPQFDDSNIVTSVTSEWNLVCDRTIFASMLQSATQLGYLPGSLISGYLSDRYGRKLISCVSYLLTSVFVSLTATAHQLWIFAALRFSAGFFIGATFTCSYVFGIEVVGASIRHYFNCIVLAESVFSYFCISLLAYFVREWRSIQLLASAPWILTISYFWLLPESPRWLITVGRREEAIESLAKIAARNGLPTENIKEIIDTSEQSKSIADQEHRGSFVDLFKTSTLGLYSITVAILWMICAHTYFGMNHFIGRLQGNIYLNTIISAGFLMTAVIVVLLFTTFLKRRLGLLISFITASLSLLVYLVTPSSLYFNLPFISVGLIGVGAAFSQMYLYSSEIFPTVVRNSALGFASMSGRIGSVIAPFVVNATTDWTLILIFTLLQLIAAVLCLILPETKGIVLLNTIEQTEKLRRKEIESYK